MPWCACIVSSISVLPVVSREMVAPPTGYVPAMCLSTRRSDRACVGKRVARRHVALAVRCWSTPSDGRETFCLDNRGEPFEIRAQRSADGRRTTAFPTSKTSPAKEEVGGRGRRDAKRHLPRPPRPPSGVDRRFSVHARSNIAQQERRAYVRPAFRRMHGRFFALTGTSPGHI